MKPSLGMKISAQKAGRLHPWPYESKSRQGTGEMLFFVKVPMELGIRTSISKDYHVKAFPVKTIVLLRVFN